MNIKFTLALDREYTLEECEKAAAAMIERLERFIGNGCSTEGTDLPYKVTKYTFGNSNNNP